MRAHLLLLGFSVPRRIVSTVPCQLTTMVEYLKWVLTLRITVPGEPMISKTVAAHLNISSASTMFVEAHRVSFRPIRSEYKSNTLTTWDSAERPSSRVESLSRLAMEG